MDLTKECFNTDVNFTMCYCRHYGVTDLTWAGSTTRGIFYVIIPFVDLQLRLVYTCEGTQRLLVIRRNQQQQQHI